MTRHRARRHFVEQISKYDTVDFWWLEDRLISRVVETQRGPYAVPPHAEYIGRYSHPFSPDKFLSELDDALARINASYSDTPGVA